MRGYLGDGSGDGSGDGAGGGGGHGRAPSGRARRRAVVRQPWAAAASSDWYPARSDAPVVNLLVASEIALSVATGAAAPCASEDTMVSFENDSIALRWYSENSDGSASVRAGMEPFALLNATWPSSEPTVSSHALAPSASGAPTGRVNESARKSNTPSVPGTGAATKSSPSTLSCSSNAATAQSPMTLNAALPSITSWVASGQSSPSRSSLVRPMIVSKSSSAPVTSAPSQSVLPSDRPEYASGPRSASSTVSSRCTWVHVVPTEMAVTPASSSFSRSAIHASRSSYCASGSMPFSSSTAGLAQTTFRSEERRVGKGGGPRGAPATERKHVRRAERQS